MKMPVAAIDTIRTIQVYDGTLTFFISFWVEAAQFLVEQNKL